MTSSKFLEYEITLLLTEFGHQPVLSTLAKKLGTSQEDLEAQLNTMSEARSLKHLPRRASRLDIVDRVASQNEEKGDLLRQLGYRFHSRQFLPTLPSVQRFLAEQTGTRPKVASRAKALPKLMAILAEMKRSDLERLSDDKLPTEYSALSVISGEILRRER